LGVSSRGVTTPTPVSVSEHSRGVALGLAIPLGFFGLHRFYVGKVGSGFLMAATLGGAGIWWLYDLVLVAAGEFRDQQGRRVWHWPPGGSSMVERPGGPDSAAMADELDLVRSEVRELHERVDFMERMLARLRDPAAVGPGDRGAGPGAGPGEPGGPRPSRMRKKGGFAVWGKAID